MNAAHPQRFLGLDVGGTQSRWALTDSAGHVHRNGHAAGFSGTQLHQDTGRAAVARTLREIATAAGPVQGALAGVTGLDAAQAPLLCALLAQALAIDEQAVRAMSDIELACRAHFAPGEGVLVCAGTGSIAAFIDAQGTLHRAGGRGPVIDDAGGGHWIAREALRRVWRAEDEAPGAGAQSPLAQQLFKAIGGSEWSQTRQWVYGATRGELGMLALAVAAAADEDPAALALLHAAGAELARLALVLRRRFGPLPVALAGRVFELHPAVRASVAQALPAGSLVQRPPASAEVEAARIAARMGP